MFLDFKIPDDNWDESNSSDMDSYGSDCDDMITGNWLLIIGPKHILFIDLCYIF